MSKPHDYYLKVNGKGFDEDGAYGIQCVDGFKHFCRTELGFNISHKSICQPSGYAYSIWDNFDSLGLGNYFEKVYSCENLQDGDWVIFNKGSKSCKDSHIAMFRQNNGNGTGIFLGQNQNGHREYTQVNLYLSGIRGALRPKIYINSNNTNNSNNSNKQYINLKPSVSSWRVYPLEKSPVKGNEKGFLNPQKFGGLTYYIYAFHDNNTTAEIQTSNFGRGKIWINDTNCYISNNPSFEYGEY